ncbi:hypothetical protein V2J09_021995 [Rumex salicifolius]
MENRQTWLCLQSCSNFHKHKPHLLSFAISPSYSSPSSSLRDLLSFLNWGLQEIFFARIPLVSKAPISISRANDEPKQPKFGARDDGEVPYTAYFDNPGKTKPSPIEPQVNRDQAPAQANKPNPPHVSKPRESGQSKKADEPLPKQDNASLRTSFESHQQHGTHGTNSADSNAKPHAVKSSSGGVSVEQSPIHPRTGGRGSGSQPSSYDSWQGASTKPRHRTATRAAPNHKGGGPAVPEFGAWNKNPEQAEGYTDVFNQVLTEKKTPGHANAATSTPRRISKKQTEGNCFSRLFKCFSSSG